MTSFGRSITLLSLMLASAAFGGYLKSEFHELDQDAEHPIGSRSYVVHLPARYDNASALPVVLVFHGRGGFPGTVARQSGMNTLADKKRFMVVYPEGTGQPNNGSFNAGRCCGDAARYNVDDVGFVRDVLDDLQSRYKIDSKRVYATGMSNGASMAFRIAAELADRIAAIGPVSGNQGFEGPLPSRPVPVICFYGMRDPYMFPRSMFPTIQWWIRANRCREKPVKVVQKKDYVMERYEPPPGIAGAPVVFYKVTEGGHTWPGGIDINRGPGAGRTIQTVPATALMWKFFSEN
jgi:polyhydroxybutyrate depolymerase